MAHYFQWIRVSEKSFVRLDMLERVDIDDSGDEAIARLHFQGSNRLVVASGKFAENVRELLQSNEIYTSLML